MTTASEIADGTAVEESASSGHGPRIGLTLSGGGVRAAVFHLGVLRRLAVQGLLESVATISTVSGGSLVMAAVMSSAGMKWPSSGAFGAEVFPELRRIAYLNEVANSAPEDGFGDHIRCELERRRYG